MTHKFKGTIFWKEEGVGAKEAKMEARRPKGIGPHGQILWPLGTHPFGPRGSVAVDLSSRSFLFYLKTTIKIVPRCFPEGSAIETQKHQNRDLELQIGGGKLRRGAAGVVSISPDDISTISMMKRE